MKKNPFILELLPEDPIFGVDQAFKKDPRPEKISLVVGSYRDENGNPWTPHVLSEAEKLAGKGKEYLPIGGDPEFIEGVRHLFGNKDLLVFQAIGGAGALTLGAELAKRGIEGATLHLPNPTWANHSPLFKRAGLEIETYPYPDIQGMVKKIEKLTSKDLFLLHLVCHNPTGIDPSLEEWEQLAIAFTKGNGIPFFDLAYLGFGEGIKEDLLPLKPFIERKIPFLLAFSGSKSFGLYGERVGALIVSVGEGQNEVESNVKQIIRTSYSNPPRYGVNLVSKILLDPKLFELWETDLRTMRERLKNARLMFLEEIQKPLENVAKGRGMFALLPLKEEAVEALRDKEAIYIPQSGRISFSGITKNNCHRIVKALSPFLQ